MAEPSAQYGLGYLYRPLPARGITAVLAKIRAVTMRRSVPTYAMMAGAVYRNNYPALGEREHGRAHIK